MAISLNDLKRVKANDPARILIYGPPGIGKTNLAAEFPAPVFLQTEEGTPGGLELTSFGLLTSYAALMDSMLALLNEPHEFRTFVIDSISEVEKLVLAEVCSRHRWRSIEEPGYGKGYKEADYVWSEFVGMFNQLRKHRQMTAVLIGHAQIKRFDDPTSQSYSRYDLDLHDRAIQIIDREMDAIFLIKQEVALMKEDLGFQKSRAVNMSADQRWIHTSPRPNYTAKNRYSMPDRLLFKQGEGYAVLAQYLPQVEPAPARSQAA